MRRYLSWGLNFLKTRKWWALGGLVMLLVAAALAVFSWLGVSRAEQSGGSPESGATSRIKTIYDALAALSYGSDAAGAWGNWGAYWNRIYSAGQWTPSGNATAATVGSGSTFYSNSRTQQTGTYQASGNCPTQLYHDSYGPPATQTTNCTDTITWTVPGGGITGTDKQDPRTGLIWSKYLKNNAGTVEFADSGGSNWNWDGTLKFTVTAATAAAGDTYTNNGQTFTVGYALAGATTLYAKPASSGLPAASGNLDRVTGSGTNPIVFSAYTLYGSNVAVGAKTAKVLCSDRGDGWRLPVQKELMQAYIDGSFWNLTNPSTNFWSATENAAPNAWYVNLNDGTTATYGKSTFTSYVRCVR